MSRWLVVAASACLLAARPAAGGVPADGGAPFADESANGALPRLGIPVACERYAAALDRIQASPGPFAVESLFVAGVRAADALTTPAGNESENALHKLSDTAYVRVQDLMRGFLLSRELGDYVNPDPRFFLALSREHGGPADTAFFSALGATYIEGGPFPAYIHQETDESGCTMFGSGLLVDSFDTWFEFSTRHPKRYAPQAKDELERIMEQIEFICACDDRDSVLRELQAFLRRFPATPWTPRVRSRLRAVESGDAAIHYHCVPG